MKRRIWIVALIVGLAGSLGFWGHASAEAPEDEATGTVGEGYAYDVLPGLLPDTSAGTIALTDGWHVADNPYAGLDFAYVTAGTTDPGDPVYAVIHTVAPSVRIPQLAPSPPLIAARIGPDTNDRPLSESNTGCRRVEVLFFDAETRETVGTMLYKHVYPTVIEGTSVPLARTAKTTADPFQIGELAPIMSKTLMPKRDGVGCKSYGEHLHQEAPYFQTEPNVHRNVPAHNRSNPASAPTSLTLRYGFLTQGEGGDPNKRLLPRQYRPVCADTWVFRVQASATPPDPSPVSTCDAPWTTDLDERPTILNALSVERGIGVSWREPPTAWDDTDTTERNGGARRTQTTGRRPGSPSP